MIKPIAKRVLGQRRFDDWRRRLRTAAEMDEVRIVHQFFSGAGQGLLMLDVGAHQGGSLLRFAESGWRVHAFEPDAGNRRVLEEAARAFPNVSVWPYAVVASDEPAVTFYAHATSSYLGSLRAFDAGHQPAGFSVPAINLSTFCARHGITTVDFLKVDAEGFDLEVLEGVNWSANRPAVILCEFDERKEAGSCDALLNFLASLGYHLLVSEWHPVSSYTGPFIWRRFFMPPDRLADIEASGNLIAVSARGAFERLRALCERSKRRYDRARRVQRWIARA